MAGKDFLGTGMKFPPQINNATGRFVLSSAETSVRESVYLILMTAMGERFMRPNFGSNLASYTFMDVNATTVGIMRRNLVRFILTQEPRISEVEVDVDNVTRPGALLVNITYTVSATNEKENMVFPFYLNNDSADSELEEAAGVFRDDEGYSLSDDEVTFLDDEGDNTPEDYDED